jgi:starvation-inducible DNA-binding protein
MPLGRNFTVSKNLSCMRPNIDITEGNLLSVAKLLNNILADEYVLYTKTRNAHWNVQGANFMELHKFFESQYDVIDSTIDDVAERVRSLGHFAIGSMKDFLAIARLLENHDNFTQPKSIIETLLADHETIIRILRKDAAACANEYGDLGTSDFLTGIMEQHEKMAWMLRAYIS